jgi:hypothetical protein
VSVVLFVGVRPGVEIVTVESDALRTDLDLGDVRPNLGVEEISVDTEIGGRIPHAQVARQQHSATALAALGSDCVVVHRACVLR